jgi:hypothetical protein
MSTALLESAPPPSPPSSLSPSSPLLLPSARAGDTATAAAIGVSLVISLGNVDAGNGDGDGDDDGDGDGDGGSEKKPRRPLCAPPDRCGDGVPSAGDGAEKKPARPPDRCGEKSSPGKPLPPPLLLFVLPLPAFVGVEPVGVPSRLPRLEKRARGATVVCKDAY